jgi:hypothetical protein
MIELNYNEEENLHDDDQIIIPNQKPLQSVARSPISYFPSGFPGTMVDQSIFGLFQLKSPVEQDPYVTLYHTELISARYDFLIRQHPIIHVNNRSVADMYGRLFSGNSSHLTISGPPGSGKSTTSFYYVLKAADHFRDQPIIWISLDTNLIIYFFNGYLDVQQFAPEDLTTFSPKNIQFRYKSSSKSPAAKSSAPQNACFVYIDGVRKHHICYFTHLVEWFALSYIRIITSDQSVDIGCNRLTPYRLLFWTMDDYRALCQSDIVFATVVVQLGGNANRTYTIDEKVRLLNYKYFYGGYSLRYMFEMNVDDVTVDLSFAMGSISHKPAFCRFEVETAADRAVNKLLVTAGGAGGGIRLVSEYVLRKFQREFDRTDIILLHANSNIRWHAVMDGWACEADILWSVRHNQLGSRFFDVNFLVDGPAIGVMNETYVAGGQVFDFCRNSVTKLVTLTDITVNDWFIPEVYNPGGFDAVQVIAGRNQSPFVLRFIQVTRQSNHELKVDYMRIFLQKMNDERLRIHNRYHPNQQTPQVINEMEIVIVYPSDLLDRVPNPSNNVQWIIRGAPRKSNPDVTYQVVTFHRLH